MLDNAVEEFGRRMGLPNLSLPPTGVMALDVQGLGRLHLECASHQAQGLQSPKVADAEDDERLLLCLARPMPVHETHRRRKALELCHHNHGHPLPLTAGLRGDDLVLLTWLQGRDLHGVALENAVRFLAGMADRIFAA